MVPMAWIARNNRVLARPEETSAAMTWTIVVTTPNPPPTSSKPTAASTRRMRKAPENQPLIGVSQISDLGKCERMIWCDTHRCTIPTILREKARLEPALKRTRDPVGQQAGHMVWQGWLSRVSRRVHAKRRNEYGIRD